LSFDLVPVGRIVSLDDLAHILRYPRAQLDLSPCHKYSRMESVGSRLVGLRANAWCPTWRSVPMAVMRIRNMAMGMRFSAVLMPMRMRLCRRIVRFVLVLMMFVVPVAVRMSC